MLEIDHVTVTIVREVHVQAVAGFARLPMPDVIGEDDVVLGHVEGLSGSEELPGKNVVEELSARSAGTMQNEHSIANDAL